MGPAYFTLAIVPLLYFRLAVDAGCPEAAFLFPSARFTFGLLARIIP